MRIELTITGPDCKGGISISGNKDSVEELKNGLDNLCNIMNSAIEDDDDPHWEIE
jgi:hypothetical protein